MYSTMSNKGCKKFIFSFLILITALNEALTAEVQRLKIATADMGGEAAKFQQLSLNSQMYQMHQQQQQQQSNQLNMHQLQQQKQQSQSQQNESTNTKHESG